MNGKPIVFCVNVFNMNPAVPGITIYIHSHFFIHSIIYAISEHIQKSNTDCLYFMHAFHQSWELLNNIILNIIL